MAAHILVIENNIRTAQLLELELSCEGYQVNVVEDGTSGLIAARIQNPDLLILSWELSGTSCLEICQRLRSTNITLPILVLTEDRACDRIAGLEAGADDCITQPFNIQELIARVRAQLRRIQKEMHVLQFEELVLDRVARQVFLSFHLIKLTTKEFDLLEYLMLHTKQVLTREQIMQNVWGYDFMGDSNILEVYIRYLRLKLEAHQNQRLIQTVRGVGYVLRM